MHFSSVHEKKKTRKCEVRCEICTVKFAYKFDLKAHVTQVHETETLKPYQCNWVLENGLLCGKKLYKAHNLKVHMQMHRGIKSFSCYVCGKSFRQNAHLKKHKKIHFRNDLDHTQSLHEGKKAHTCAICQKSFAQKLRKSLNSHARSVHEGKQPNIPSKGNHEGKG